MAAPQASRPRVFLDVCIGQEPVGRLTIELFADKAPKTCENFRQLCTAEHNGLSYAQSPFHRIIDEFMVQGGDIANGDGTGVTSIYGGEFEDENLDWREMDAPGLICSANRGKDTNGSQFFVTVEPCEHLNGKHTIFGRLVSGQEVLSRIAKVDVDMKDCPKEPVLVARCGELERKKKADGQQQSQPAQIVDRGRPRKSDASSKERIQDDGQASRRRNRRQSDNVIDEGLRGRPRQRSSLRSNNAIESADEDMSDATSRSSHSSRVYKHKRKRSTSPSRHNDRPSTDDYGQRRRRSLPNQYAEERRSRETRGHEDRDHARRESRRDDQHSRSSQRTYDRYRPWRNRGDSGRLGSGGRDNDFGRRSDTNEAHVRFKGRGIMKYREDRKEDGRL